MIRGFDYRGFDYETGETSKILNKKQLKIIPQLELVVLKHTQESSAETQESIITQTPTLLEYINASHRRV